MAETPAKGRGKHGLNPRQLKFCEEYVKNMGNGTQAARAAGYGSPEVHASRLLDNAKVRAHLAKLYKRLHMGEEEVLARLAGMARADLTEFVDDKGKVDLAKVKKRGFVIKKLKRGSDGELELETYDAQAALVHVGKALGTFKESVSLGGSDGGPLSVNLLIDPSIITGVPAGGKKEGA